VKANGIFHVSLRTMKGLLLEKILVTERGRFTVRPYCQADEESVLSLWKAAFKKDMDPRLWRWKYRDNPYGHRIVLCVSEEGIIVALYGGIPYKANHDGRIVEIINLMDLMSHPDYRGEGLFVRTGRIFFDFYCRPDGASFVYGFPGEYHFVLGEKYLGYRALEQPVIFLSAQPLDMAGKKRTFGGRVERLEKPDSCLDDLWERCQEAYPLTAIRDAGFSKWRFFAHPFQEYEVWVYRSRFRRQVKAYAVFVVEEKKAAMIDIFSVPSEKVLSDFFARLAAEFLGRGIVEINTWLPDSHFIAEDALSAGFKRAPEPKGVVSTVRTFDHSPSLESISRNLFYTMADVDLF
jgi:hypothetical protein